MRIKLQTRFRQLKQEVSTNPDLQKGVYETLDEQGNKVFEIREEYEEKSEVDSKSSQVISSSSSQTIQNSPKYNEWSEEKKKEFQKLKQRLEELERLEREIQKAEEVDRENEEEEQENEEENKEKTRLSFKEEEEEHFQAKPIMQGLIDSPIVSKNSSNPASNIDQKSLKKKVSFQEPTTSNPLPSYSINDPSQILDVCHTFILFFIFQTYFIKFFFLLFPMFSSFTFKKKNSTFIQPQKKRNKQKKKKDKQKVKVNLKVGLQIK